MRSRRKSWRAQGGAGAARAAYAENTISAPRFEIRAEGGEYEGRGDWRFESGRFAGFSLIAERPSAGGAFTFGWRDGFTADAPVRVTLARTQLDGRGRERLHEILPNLPQAPIGPTFAAAENAADRAASRFDLALPLRFTANGQSSTLLLENAAEAQAASGARLRLAPLRRDAPAFALDLPSLALRGAAALELSGGGAPRASLLLDTIAWAPQAAFDADGTLSLTDWRADGASINAPELGVSITVNPEGEGQMDVRGPAVITGPLGDGEVRDLSSNLDLGIRWGQGWAVAPARQCLPITLGGLDVAGLSFAGGRFALCAQNNTLISADARGNLGGGFQIEALTLSGRMAGEDGQPARLETRRLTGNFSGVSSDIRLAVVADAPTLTIDMSDERALSLVMARLTANARIDRSWRVEGQFERGGLADPALPGGVSAIAGRWSAAPENDKPVIRVDAGEALLEANRPASDEERPLFNPMRLAGVSAVFRDGVIDAEGAVRLNASGQQLARFTAHHQVSDGGGEARIHADEIAFGQDLQPYDISELARGVVDNVRGPASGEARVTWTRETMQSDARIALDGVSLASATIPLIGDTRGEIYFDDLFKLTTPPGQEVSVGVLNPGVAVTNGRVRFQLREAGVIAIEHAEFAFAGGVLAMRPEVITLGADETNIELTLRDVDAASLIAQLNVPDLQATGVIEGSFPLRLTRQSAIVTNGVLRAAGGGRIAYTGARRPSHRGRHARGLRCAARFPLRGARPHAQRRPQWRGGERYPVFRRKCGRAD
ncbi:MAG: YdbH domain-containing protein [Terricaulis sp.]|nr:YdbH domain-containing protein [Terricaulis sp.]